MKEINKADKKNLKLFKVFTIFKFFNTPQHPHPRFLILEVQILL